MRTFDEAFLFGGDVMLRPLAARTKRGTDATAFNKTKRGCLTLVGAARSIRAVQVR